MSTSTQQMISAAFVESVKGAIAQPGLWTQATVSTTRRPFLRSTSAERLRLCTTVHACQTAEAANG